MKSIDAVLKGVASMGQNLQTLTIGKEEAILGACLPQLPPAWLLLRGCPDDALRKGEWKAERQEGCLLGTLFPSRNSHSKYQFCSSVVN